MWSNAPHALLSQNTVHSQGLGLGWSVSWSSLERVLVLAECTYISINNILLVLLFVLIVTRWCTVGAPTQYAWSICFPCYCTCKLSWGVAEHNGSRSLRLALVMLRARR
jgi:hypothetical protein